MSGSQEFDSRTWSKWLDDNSHSIREKIDYLFTVKLAEKIIHHIDNDESWELTNLSTEERGDIEGWLNGVAITKNGRIPIRSVSDHYGKEHYFRMVAISDEDNLWSFFDAYQFEMHSGVGDFNFPCTWVDMLDEWWFDIFSPEQLAEYWEQNIPAEITASLKKLCGKDFSWEYLYMEQPDHSVFFDFLHNIFVEIHGTLERTTIGNLRKMYASANTGKWN